MLTHFFKSINWVDVALVILLVRVIFIAVKNGFIAELCKFLGVLLALYIGLHFYPMIKIWPFVSFLILVSLGYALFWGIRLGLSMLFKAEAQHEGFNKYAAGLLAIGRGLLTASVVIFGLLLIQHPWVHRQTFDSIAYKLVGKTAPHVYSVIYKNFIGQIFGSNDFNKSVYKVVSESK